MDGRRLAGVGSGLGSSRRLQRKGESPVHLDFTELISSVAQARALEAAAPLLSQLPFIELTVKDSSASQLPALAGSLAATTTKLQLTFLPFHSAWDHGKLSTVRGWVELLGALPHVQIVQITFTGKAAGRRGHEQACFPVYSEDCMLSRVKPAVERVMDCAISACEQKGR
jgi:hypothetical protein